MLWCIDGSTSTANAHMPVAQMHRVVESSCGSLELTFVFENVDFFNIYIFIEGARACRRYRNADVFVESKNEREMGTRKKEMLTFMRVRCIRSLLSHWIWPVCGGSKRAKEERRKIKSVIWLNWCCCTFRMRDAINIQKYSNPGWEFRKLSECVNVAVVWFHIIDHEAIDSVEIKLSKKKCIQWRT